MALVVIDSAQETTSTTGTGTLTLTGAVAQCQSFANIGNGNTTYYRIISGNDIEVGIGTYTSAGTTLSRDTVLYSSLGGTTKITVAAGAKVICTYPAEVSIYASNNASQTAGQFLQSNGVGTAPTWQTLASRVVAIPDGTSITINADTTDIATQANTQVAGTLTINAPTGTPVNGQKVMLRLTSTNVQTFSFNAIFTGSTDLSLPTASSGSSKTDYLGFIYQSTTSKWNIIAKNFGF